MPGSQNSGGGSQVSKDSIKFDLCAQRNLRTLRAHTVIGFGIKEARFVRKSNIKRILRASQLTRRMLLDSPDFCIGHQSTVNGKTLILDPHLDIAGVLLFRNSSHLQLDLVPKGNSLSFHVTLFLYCGEKGI